MCHVSQIRRPGKDSVLVEGMGNYSVDFIGWVDAVRSSLLDENRLTPDTIADAYEKKFNRPLSFSDRMMIRVWLPGTRTFFKNNLPKYDAPFGGKDLRDSRLMPNGPAPGSSKSDPDRLDTATMATTHTTRVPPHYNRAIAGGTV
jgi:hypothetical protein